MDTEHIQQMIDDTLKGFKQELALFQLNQLKTNNDLQVCIKKLNDTGAIIAKELTKYETKTDGRLTVIENKPAPSLLNLFKKV